MIETTCMNTRLTLYHLELVYCATLHDMHQSISSDKMLSNCLDINAEVSTRCHELETLQEEPSYIKIQDDITREQETVTCSQSLFKLSGNGVTNCIYVKQQSVLWAFNTFVTLKSELRNISIFWLNRNIGRFHLEFNISINKNCPAYYRGVHLHIAYTEPINHRTVVLYWQLYLHNGWKSIALSQIPAPYTSWIVYITHIFQLNSVGIKQNMHVCTWPVFNQKRNMNWLPECSQVMDMMWDLLKRYRF